jgi:hypothetical protein
MQGDPEIESKAFLQLKKVYILQCLTLLLDCHLDGGWQHFLIFFLM